jgi:hypothetical protein
MPQSIAAGQSPVSRPAKPPESAPSDTVCETNVRRSRPAARSVTPAHANPAQRPGDSISQRGADPCTRTPAHSPFPTRSPTRHRMTRTPGCRTRRHRPDRRHAIRRCARQGAVIRWIRSPILKQRHRRQLGPVLTPPATTPAANSSPGPDSCSAPSCQSPRTCYTRGFPPTNTRPAGHHPSRHRSARPFGRSDCSSPWKCSPAWPGPRVGNGHSPATAAPAPSPSAPPSSPTDTSTASCKPGDTGGSDPRSGHSSSTAS